MRLFNKHDDGVAPAHEPASTTTPTVEPAHVEEPAGVPVEAHAPRMVCMALREDTVTGDMMAAEWVRVLHAPDLAPNPWTIGVLDTAFSDPAFVYAAAVSVTQPQVGMAGMLDMVHGAGDGFACFTPGWRPGVDLAMLDGQLARFDRSAGAWSLRMFLAWLMGDMMRVRMCRMVVDSMHGGNDLTGLVDAYSAQHLGPAGTRLPME